MNEPAQTLRTLLRLVSFLALVLFISSIARAQQPFFTDDADVTPRGKFHFEFSNQFDLVHRSAFPNLKQNTAEFEVDYGLFEGVEIGVIAPLLTFFNDPGTSPKTVTGIGDMNLSVKYNFRQERENSGLPAMTISVNFELPTGDTERQLGSGLADVHVNGVLQKSLTKRTKLRVNGGVLFSGNQTTGVVEIKSRGTVFTTGGSLIRQFTPKLQLGMELTGATTKDAHLGKTQLQTLFGGNYLVKDTVSFDFGIIAGKYVASPRVGVQLGISIDF